MTPHETMDIGKLLEALTRIYERRGYELNFKIERKEKDNEKED